MRKLLLVVLLVALLLPVATPALADSIYVVQAGDTLSAISVRFGVSMSAIMAANGIINPNVIYVGQRLTIPSGSGPAPTTTSAPPTPGPTTGTYVVQRGDTLGIIAGRFGTTVSALVTANGLTNANLIFVGQVLRIPGGGGTAPTATPPPPTATGTQPPPPSSGGSTYTVRRGDTLGAIARSFGVSLSALMTANSIINANLIFIGQVLTIPGGSGPVPTATSAPPSTGTAPPPPPPSGTGGFELGGQVADFTTTDLMKYAGMYWVKRQVRWAPGASADAGLIDDAHARGFKILLSVLGNPADISGGANFDSYAAYVGELARLGADGIEVWNEMNLDREWPAGQISPTTYVEMLRRSYTAIKARNPNTLVISGAPSPTGAEGAFGLDRVWNDNRYMAGMAAAGAASYADCIGVHYNEGIISPTQTSGDPRDNYYTRYYFGMVNTYYNAFGGARKLCFTELGYLSPEGYGPLPGAFAWAGGTSAAEHAQWLGEAANLAKNGGKVRLMIVFNVDATYWGDDPQAGYAMVRPGGGCPACDALRAVTGGR